ncbi:MAG: SUMF1/EgtB/PvdO family nonheme iron enzyme [Anaerolineales bacterium]|uniref:SUMF1/EgtB/PvdO family nonheme iron enzyme n=1 Tax=Candidatus Desulfolinea nitratireducens TaxID=2841698 RepID=A0A8J6NKQ1_9CHLR|nr:SUMF1/EgtB/PvdO family nonheme iron enzyme [Candidatus Desulfolinea nitratireducens]MBL6959656.1 SUMF1/EgtB/PvdO family nonheme iron enzyme [Anaerolineales bacterium]
MHFQCIDGITWLDAEDSDVLILQSGEKWQSQNDYRNHPVVEVSWHGTQAYCSWVNMRMPTEAQWEKAARSGFEGKKYP